MAISGLDFENGRDLHLRLSNSGLTIMGMAWHLDGGVDSAMNMATRVGCSTFRDIKSSISSMAV